MVTIVEVSDRLWSMGSLEEIKKEVDPSLFDFHIAINMIGNWKGDGWWFLICEQAIPIRERKEQVKAVREAVERLEEATEPLWGYGTKDDGWSSVIHALTGLHYYTIEKA